MQTQIAELQQELISVKEQLRLLKNGRNSNTSSTPPSHDLGRSNKKSLREPSSRKTGGQVGHDGSTLQMKENPDKVIEHRPNFCKQCGDTLATEDATLVSRRQEIVLPPIVPQYIEHQSYSCTCTKCGCVTISELPDHLKANVQYGPEINALTAYFSVRQYIPYNRIAEMMNHIFNLPLSEGTIDNMLNNLTKKAKNIYEDIRKRVEQSPEVGGDETGIKINNKKGWLFTFQTPKLTFLAASFCRGYETIEKLFKNGFPISVYISDCLPAQLKVPAKLHQICIAHLLRELNNFIDACQCNWSSKMKQLFKDAIELKSQLQPDDYNSSNEKVIFLQQQLDGLLCTEIEGKHKKVKAFIKRLNKNHDAIFTFLYHPKVPPDNNSSEQTMRNSKVKMKVSGQFKSMEGAHRFAVLRSVIDTAIKNSQNVLEALCVLSMMPAE